MVVVVVEVVVVVAVVVVAVVVIVAVEVVVVVVVAVVVVRYKACPSNYVSYLMAGKQCILYHWWRWTQEAAARRNARAISTTRQS